MQSNGGRPSRDVLFLGVLVWVLTGPSLEKIGAQAHWAHSFVVPKGPGPNGPLLGDSFEEVIGFSHFYLKYVGFSQQHTFNMLEGHFPNKKRPRPPLPTRLFVVRKHVVLSSRKSTVQKWVLRDLANMNDTQ